MHFHRVVGPCSLMGLCLCLCCIASLVIPTGCGGLAAPCLLVGDLGALLASIRPCPQYLEAEAALSGDTVVDTDAAAATRTIKASGQQSDWADDESCLP